MVVVGPGRVAGGGSRTSWDGNTRMASPHRPAAVEAAQAVLSSVSNRRAMALFRFAHPVWVEGCKALVAGGSSSSNKQRRVQSGLFGVP